jgi:hypothetical protein
MHLIDAAVAILDEMATFEEAGVATTNSVPGTGNRQGMGTLSREFGGEDRELGAADPHPARAPQALAPNG